MRDKYFQKYSRLPADLAGAMDICKRQVELRKNEKKY